MINTPIIYDPATGMFVADSSASNEFLNPIQNVQLLNGLLVNPGEFINTTMRFIVGTATASQTIIGSVTFDGYWE